jgi:hypothetical protein
MHTLNAGNFLPATASRPALGPTAATHWAPGALSLGLKRLGREADHSLPCTAQVKNAWSCTTASPCAFMAWCLDKQGIHLYGMWLS